MIATFFGIAALAISVLAYTRDNDTFSSIASAVVLISVELTEAIAFNKMGVPIKLTAILWHFFTLGFYMPI